MDYSSFFRILFLLLKFVNFTIPYSDQEEEDMSSTKKEVKSEKTEAPGKEGKGDKGRPDEFGTDEKVDVDGEVVGTDSVSRGGACSFHTQPLDESSSKQLTPEEVQALRQQLEQQLATWTTPPAGPEAVQAWSQFSAATSGLARDLCEQLRLVLEPTQAARLKGDYRTGRRINMRKVCPHFLYGSADVNLRFFRSFRTLQVNSERTKSGFGEQNQVEERTRWFLPWMTLPVWLIIIPKK